MALRVAVIGTGNMGIHHLRNYYHNPDVELIGFVETNEKNAAKVKSKYPIEQFINFKEVLGKVDAVSIATPTSTHFEVASFFLNHQIHVLLEKPITDNIEEAENLIEIAKQKNVLLSIGHIERFNPVIQELKDILKKEKPVFIEIHRESPFDSRIYDVDVISDLMIHDIDALYYILKRKLNIISSIGVKVHSNKNDLVNVHLSSDNILINIITSRATEQKIRNWRVVLKDKLIEADLLERKLYLSSKTEAGKKIFDTNTEHQYSQEQITAKILMKNDEPLRIEIDNFIQSILGNTVLEVEGKDGLKALKLIKAIQDSIITI
ncbi:Gfo/Idh/MocA family oxidoreductase [Paenibacillus sp. KACC 21273]|uniref:Gfo/Idh/MocA family protein n=1 Tax=Paenibacillus sp. KACC 21273 TaxID=3025665 RepID=UPI002365A47C|nr:Gfo/Idh/MocA family oxidoreductase [Paenibacillus sp. KACC 21273]WDF51479.1 Gfo/Idh/MocA family oxidoreductase [Paenibacillus sp. KACC 21273]